MPQYAENQGRVFIPGLGGFEWLALWLSVTSK